MPEILEFVAFRDSGNIFQQFSRDFPGVSSGTPERDPGNSHSLLEFSKKQSNTHLGPEARTPKKKPATNTHIVGPRATAEEPFGCRSQELRAEARDPKVVKRRTCYKPQNPEKLKYGKVDQKVKSRFSGTLESRSKVGKKG